MKVFVPQVVTAVGLVVLICSCSQDPSSTDNGPTAGESPSPPPVESADASAATGKQSTLEAPLEKAWTARQSFEYPDAPSGLPPGLPPAQPLDTTVVLAWNDLGMHCYQPDFSMFQILPPHNVFWAQVIGRDRTPTILTEGIAVRYKTLHVTNPSRYTNFWDYAGAYGWQLERDAGLHGKRTSGQMEAVEDHFVAEGVPVVDMNDDGAWDPFPMFTVSVENAAGESLAQTLNVAAASSEMACDLCHVADSMQGSMAAILKAHDENEDTELLSQAEAGKPVMCSSCHADPAMGVTQNKDCELSLSAAMHSFHADKWSEAKRDLPENQCHACHPGPKTKCLRDVMSQSGLTCTNCHGGMAEVGEPTRIAWVNMPSCTSCHTDALGEPVTIRIKNPNGLLTPKAASLYRNSKAHGGGGIYCAACHGSPHAVTPTATKRDNLQAIRLQGHEGMIDQCAVCHLEKPDKEFWHFR